MKSRLPGSTFSKNIRTMTADPSLIRLKSDKNDYTLGECESN